MSMLTLESTIIRDMHHAGTIHHRPGSPQTRITAADSLDDLVPPVLVSSLLACLVMAIVIRLRGHEQRYTACARKGMMIRVTSPPLLT
jgi:hypothetical protein